MEKYCYLNGKILDIKDAKVSVTDIGILRGFGVFDGLRTYNGKPFLFDKHFERFQHSAKMLGLKIPLSKKETKNIIIKLAKKNKVSDTSVRIVLTGGESEDGTGFDPNKPTFYILLHTLLPISVKMYEEGVKLITVDYQRELPEAKTNNYITKLANNSKRLKQDAHEILYISNGLVLEGATCNVFIIKNDKLITPKENILFGTRRWLVLKVAKNNFKIEERKVKTKELFDADEAFITSCNRDILPVTKIDGKLIGDGKVGKNTQRLIKLYKQYVDNHTEG